MLGANAGQADLINHMKSRGWYVVACAHKSGLPGEKIADRFELVDVRDIDAVTSLAKEINADLVYSISSDIAVNASVHASERLNLPHFYNAHLIELFDKKHLLREHLNSQGLSPVAFATFAEGQIPAGWSKYPAVVKPVDAQGQRGVAIVDSPEQLAEAVRGAIGASPSKTALVEEFLSGVEISSNVLVYDGQIVVNEVSERLVHNGAHFGIPKGHLIPPYNISEDVQQAARKLIADVVRSLSITNGCLYFQMKVTPAGPRIIEIAPRLDGCHIWRAILHARGFDFLAATISVLLGEKPDVEARPISGSVYELMFQQTPPGGAFARAAFPVPTGALYHEYRYADREEVAPVNGLLEVAGYYVRCVGAAEATKYRDEVDG